MHVCIRIICVRMYPYNICKCTYMPGADLRPRHRHHLRPDLDPLDPHAPRGRAPPRPAPIPAMRKTRHKICFRGNTPQDLFSPGPAGAAGPPCPPRPRPAPPPLRSDSGVDPRAGRLRESRIFCVCACIREEYVHA